MLQIQPNIFSFLEQSELYQRQYLSELQKLERETTNSELEPGSISNDGSSIMGKNGWIYIYSGSNNFLNYFSGKQQLNEAEIYQWQDILQSRLNWHKTRNINYLHLFVPNKLAVYPEFFSNKINLEAKRPIIQLQEVCQQLFIYPLNDLVRNKEFYQLYEKQNSHWSFWGCFLIYELLCQKWGIKPNLDLLNSSITTITEKADLGVKFNLQETRLHPRVKFESDVVYDNELINYCNRGSIRILKNPQATPGKMIIFGDSYSNPGYPNYSGYKKRHIHRLTSLFAETISEVHFVWFPSIDYSYIEREKPDFVLTEMAERFLVKVPQDDPKLSIQAYAERKIKQYKSEEGSTTINRQMSKTKSKAEVNFDRGNELQSQGMLTEAIASYRQSMKIKPDYIKPLLQLAEIYEARENWSEAVKCYRRLIGLRPKNHAAYIKLAKVLKQQNKIYGTIAAYQEAIELKPDLPAKIYKDYADLILQEKGLIHTAIVAYQKAAEIKPTWGVGFYKKLASLFEKQENWSEATKYYLKALSLQEENPKLYFDLGNVYVKQGLLNEALKNYQKALQFKPDYGIVYKQIGDLLSQTNRLDDAVRCYRRTLEIRPDFKIVYRLLGDVFTKQGKQFEAHKCYQKAS